MTGLLDRKSDLVQVMVVDDQPFMRSAIRMLLESEGMAVCGEAADETEMMEVLRRTKPQVVVLDLVLRNGESLGAIPKIKRQHPETAVLVISGQAPASFAQRAMEAGAQGFLMKGGPPVEIALAARALSTGEVYFGQKI